MQINLSQKHLKAVKKRASPADEYAIKVINGEILTSRWAKLACARHIRDEGLKNYHFEPDLAQIVIDFHLCLNHSKGRWAGKPFTLELWQKFVVGSVFGWIDDNGLRRYRQVYEEEARKNGKSTRLSGACLYCLTLDGEPGAEVYTAATKRDQAKIIFEESDRMVTKSPLLRGMITQLKNNLSVADTFSKYEPLGADGDSMDGLNVHFGAIDELHAHKKRDVFDVLETATGSRDQPIIWCITTAGFDQSGICFELRDYATEVLRGTVEDDTFFAIIYTIDRAAEWPDLKPRTKKHLNDNGASLEDDWADPSIWIKANPNLGVSVYENDLERLAKKAKRIPAAQNNFLTKRLSVWTQQ